MSILLHRVKRNQLHRGRKDFRNPYEVSVPSFTKIQIHDGLNHMKRGSKEQYHCINDQQPRGWFSLKNLWSWKTLYVWEVDNVEDLDIVNKTITKNDFSKELFSLKWKVQLGAMIGKPSCRNSSWKHLGSDWKHRFGELVSKLFENKTWKLIWKISIVVKEEGKEILYLILELEVLIIRKTILAIPKYMHSIKFGSICNESLK